MPESTSRQLPLGVEFRDLCLLGAWLEQVGDQLNLAAVMGNGTQDQLIKAEVAELRHPTLDIDSRPDKIGVDKVLIRVMGTHHRTESGQLLHQCAVSVVCVDHMDPLNVHHPKAGTLPGRSKFGAYKLEVRHG
jgi:hypothetical protein